MPNISEYYQDRSGNVTVEYSDGSVRNFTLAEAVDAKIVPSATLPEGSNCSIVVSASAPSNSDGRPVGTIYFKV